MLKMSEILPLLSEILPIVALLFVVLTILANFYFKLRGNFPTNVNCWFCNSWTKVPRNSKNSFYCPSCTQYNGFNQDGDYNKVIPEQYCVTKSPDKETAISSNGLCFLCNNNQRLKIIQLANFIPMNEENYDLEIEHFREQLEKAYDLCKNCNKVLKTTIQKQNAWLFGRRLKNLYKKGLKTDIVRITKGTKSTLGGIVLLTMILTTSLTVVMTNNNFIDIILQMIPENYTEHLKNIHKTISATKSIDLHWNSISKTITFNTYIALTFLGLIIELSSWMRAKISTVKVNNCMCWLILLLVHFIRLKTVYSFYVFGLQVSCCAYLFYTYLQRKPVEKIMKKYIKTPDSSYWGSDLSDNEEVMEKPLPHSSKGVRSNLNNSQLSNDIFCKTSSFKTSSPQMKTSNIEHSFDFGFDLNKSLNDLNLGKSMSYKQMRAVSPVFSFRSDRPVLSPPKLINVNNWMAMCDCNDSNRQNLSRSSSESSGIGSQINDNQSQPIKWGYPHSQYFQPMRHYSTQMGLNNSNIFHPFNDTHASTNHRASSLFEYNTNVHYNRQISEYHF